MKTNIRLALLAGLLLLAGAARAAGTSSSVPADVEHGLEHPKATQPYLDYLNCPTPQAQEQVQLQAVLQVPDEDRGEVIAKGGCAVASTEQAPTQVDDRYSIGE